MSGFEKYLQTISVADPGLEDPAMTRERLKERFPRGATRRMTQLGLLVGAALDDLAPRTDDAVVYASGYAESRALEAYLDSFPGASPTLFQTSIHPSAVQQALITRQHPVGEFFPLTGRGHLVAHALQAALLSPAPRVLVCGGEERGTWLLEQRAASDRTFAFAFSLAQSGSRGGAESAEKSVGGVEPLRALARVSLASDEGAATELSLPAFFDALSARQSLNLVAAPGLRLKLEWL